MSGRQPGETGAATLIDSHLHLWDPGRLAYDWLRGGLRRRFSTPELRGALAHAPPVSERAFVFVQAGCSPDQALDEVAWVESLAGDLGVRGIVADAAIERGERVRPYLDALRKRPLVVGVRRMLQSEPPGFAASGSFLAGARVAAEAGLVFDACLRAAQLPDVVALADGAPRLTIVLDHLGKPPVGDPQGLQRWRVALREVAARPQIACKLSGLPAESGGTWRAEDLYPFLDAALDVGPDRVLFGSDWPVSRPYGRWCRCVLSWLARYDDATLRDAVLWRNASRLYLHR